MTINLKEEDVLSVLEQISASSRPISARDIIGDEQTVLLAVRELRRRGLVDGVFLNDSTRPGDAHGPFLYDAARLIAL